MWALYTLISFYFRETGVMLDTYVYGGIELQKIEIWLSQSQH